MNEDRYSVLIVLFLTVFLFFSGILGYMYIEGWNLHDSVYMTIITLTTTGFQEVHQLSPEGRTFTVFLLVFGMGVVAYSVTTIMNELFSIDFALRGRKRMEKKIKQLEGHTIVCGFGRMGKVICRELKKNGVAFVVIEKSPSLLSELEKTNYYWIEGDATHDEHLIKAGIEKAKVLAAMVDDDADNLYLSLAGRSLNSQLFIIARANDQTSQPKLIRAGADKVILPIVTSGLRVAQTVVNPAVDNLLNITGVDFDQNQKIQVAELKVTQESGLVGQSLSNCGWKMADVIVIGVKKSDSSFQFAPSARYEFQEGDCLVTLSRPGAFQELSQSHFQR